MISSNALEVLKRRYFIKDPNGEVIENWEELCERVANHISKDEKTAGLRKEWKQKYFDLIYNLKFIPNSPTLMNSGRPTGQLAACFVLPLQDSMSEIMDTAKDMAMIHKSAGGTGFNFGKLRPKNSMVASTHGLASGPISFMKMLNDICEQVKAGGGRRGANMGVLPCHHPDILDFIDCKQDTTQITNFNISILVTDIFMKAVINDEEYDIINPHTGNVDKKLKAKMVFDKIVENAYSTGEPGLFFIDTVNKTNEYPEEPITAVNPCITGETKIAVINRGPIPIKQLVEEGNDVPVYCSDDKGKVAIKWMRNPRITGYNKEVYKVTLDDGNTIRCTGNHKFILKDGTIKEAQELERNDSLDIMTRLSASFNYINKKSNSNSSDYQWIKKDGNQVQSEHRLIYEFMKGKIPKGNVIHHKDFNSLNNDIGNLESMSRKNHDGYHGNLMKGDNNPMRRAKTEWSKEKWKDYHDKMSVAVSGDKNGRYSGITNSEVKEHAILLTKKLERRASKKDWINYCDENNLQVSGFSQWRKNNLFGSLIGLLKWAALECGYGDTSHLDPRIVKTFQKALNSGLDAHIVDNNVFVNKKCEYCGIDFSVLYGQREVSFHSISCANKYYYKINGKTSVRAESIKKTYKEKNEKNKKLQILAYKELQNNLSRTPFLTEFKEYCQKIKTPYRFGNTFKTFGDLKDAAQLYNHRVISVELDGYEDVYNGTVDDYHNMYIGGFNNTLDNGQLVESYTLTRQCGESPLRNHESCNLGSIKLSEYYDTRFNWKALEEDIRTSTRFLDSIISRNKYSLDIIKKETEKTRKVGLGIMGWGDLLYMMGIRYGSEESIKLAEKIMKFIQDVSIKASEELGKEKGMCPVFDGRRNLWTTIIAPTGTISIIADASSGCEPIFSIAYVRTCMDNTKMEVINSVFLDALKSKGIKLTDALKAKLVVSNSLKDIKELPKEIKDIFVTAADVTPEEHVKMQAAFQKYVHGGVSKTANLQKSATKKDIADCFLLAYKLGCKGITVYRDGSRPNQVLASVPVAVKEEPKIRYRSRVLTGTTEKFETPLGNMYLTINRNKPEEEPIEVIAQIGKSGGVTLSFMEAIGRLISTSLKYKIPLLKVAKCLKGIKTTDNTSFDKKMRYYSIPDLIGKTLEQASKDTIEEEKFFNECPRCGGTLRREEGCTKCSCGYSKC